MSGNHDPVRLDQISAALVRAGCESNLVDSYSPELPQIAEASDHLCVVGGDGSLRDVVDKLSDISKIPTLSMYPAGTINLVAREAGYPSNVQKFVERVIGNAAVRQHYHGLANGAPLLVCASIGPDSEAVANVSEGLKKTIGRFAYGAALVKLLWQWPRHPIRVEADGEMFDGEAAFILKGRYFAGPWMIQPKADLTEPCFRLVILPTARRRDYLRLALSAAVHPSIASPSWHVMVASNVKVTAEKSLPVQVDGDITAYLPLTVRIAPTAMQYS
jgi:diacylglycerol kinase (ATP)